MTGDLEKTFSAMVFWSLRDNGPLMHWHWAGVPPKHAHKVETREICWC